MFIRMFLNKQIKGSYTTKKKIYFPKILVVQNIVYTLPYTKYLWKSQNRRSSSMLSESFYINKSSSLPNQIRRPIFVM